jgi:putative PIN family toxin of toxin-antitoxin system
VRAVVDANVFVSAVLRADSPPDKIVSAAFSLDFQLVTSPILLAELEEVLRLPRIAQRHGRSANEVAAFIARLFHTAIVVQPEERLSIVRDDDDNRVLEAALAGEADYVVSGDADLLSLEEYQGVQIVTPARFLAILAAQAT